MDDLTLIQLFAQMDRHLARQDEILAKMDERTERISGMLERMDARQTVFADTMERIAQNLTHGGRLLAEQTLAMARILERLPPRS